ncbi:glycosyltransferase [Stenotrophomonas sp. MH1]|uniref:Glycosyltransferase n=1 Tax=Stenotrophomonas capsici TaxID=3110230 RepID=A0ABU5V1Y1_9GAMM|nr:glycosyltransferase [Stenotrophomonas sp. MH1]MEA5667182.1 glycosyltransferase [Stenotrophomonas sp. MH1]
MHNEHGDSPDAVNPWADHINEAYYDGMGAAFGAKTRDRINWMCSQVAGESVLDVGCSQGITSILLAREGLRVTGIDIDQPTIDYAMAERAKEIASVQERIEFRCLDLAALPPAAFDTVLMGEVIEHQTSPERFLARAASFVAPGGRLVVTVPFGLNPWPDHKSTIFPGDLALGLPPGFALRELIASDGYIRMVADRDAAAPMLDWKLLLGATRIGALEVHRRYYEIVEELKQLHKQKALLQSSIQTIQGQLDGEAKERMRSELTLKEEQAKLESKMEELEALRAERDCVKSVLDSVSAENGDVRTELERSDAELRSARESINAIRAKLTGSVAETDDLRLKLANASELQSRHAKVQKQLSDEKQALESQLVSLRSEFAVAQQKRTGHFLHLEAEREYVRILQERMRELHEENYRFTHSLALAIGQAVLQLRTLRGIFGFPIAVLRALNAYRRRDGSIPKLSLPTRPSHRPLPSSGSAGAASSQMGASPAVSVAGDLARKQLSIAGWTQQLAPGKSAVMSVMDEFSRACFAPHANLIEPRPDNWEGLLDRYRPQFLFIESSWKGNSGTWQYRVANYANPPGNEVLEMVAEFKKRGIPTVFWNKEDPVHFNDFVGKAIHFDHVFTTAEEAIKKYADRTTAKVSVLQFAAEETLHNPVGSGERNSKVCFAGSFYANRFPERRDDQLMLLDAALEHDFDIFDRNHKPGSLASDFSFPERFSKNIRGSLPYSDVNDAYRRYRVFLNVNSVVDSPTMFSRRVFELLACGTPVVSTWSEGTEATFGDDLVWHVRTPEQAREALSVLMNDDREWTRRSLSGIREVFAKHTYRHRFQQIHKAIGLEQIEKGGFAEVLVVAEAESGAAARQLLDAFHRQILPTGSTKRLMLVCRGDVEVEAGNCLDVGEVQVIRSERRITEVVSEIGSRPDGDALAVMTADAVYGKFYLQDLMNALRYSGATVVGKPCDMRQQYRYDVELDQASLVMDLASLSIRDCVRLLGKEELAGPGEKTRFAADSANFRRVGEVLDRSRYQGQILNIEI